jgi:hypothetical protein
MMVQVNNNPTAKAYVIAYSKRAGPYAGLNRIYAQVRRSFAFRRYSFDRVVLIDGGSRESETGEMWLVPAGASPPVPKPSVDSSLVKKSKQRITFPVYD